MTFIFLFLLVSFFWIWSKGGDADMLFHLVHIILYSWVGELKRRKKATAVLYNKQDDATRDQLSSFLAFFFMLLLFSVYIPGFLFFFFYFHPHQPPNAFYDCDVPFFSLFNLLSLYSPLPNFLLLISVGRKKHLPWCWYPTECYFYFLVLGLDWIGWKDKKRAKKQKRINCRTHIAFFIFIVYIPPPCMYMFLISNAWMIDSWLVLG